MRKVFKKPNNSAGFTLTETLVAVLILVLMTAAALPAAMNAYRNAVDAANAEVLLSTTVNALRSELSTAWNVTDKETAALSDKDSALVVKEGTVITFSSAETGNQSQIFVDTSGTAGRIMLLEYGVRTGDDNGWLQEDKLKTSAARPLVSDAMRQTTRNSSEHMTVTYDEVSTADDGTYVIIKNLTVKRGENEIAKMPEELLIRVMSAESAGSANGAAGG